MAFFDVPRGSAGLTMSVSDRSKGGRAIRFGLPIQMIQEAGFENGGECAHVRFGFGRDYGKVQIIISGVKKDGWYTLSGSTKQQKALNLSCMKIGIVFEECTGIDVPYDVKDGIIIADIPEEIMETATLNSTGRLRSHRAEELDKLNKAKKE